MGPGEHRPLDEQYWIRPWATQLFAGDLLEAIPFGEQPTVVYTAEEDEASGKHFIGEVVFGYGLLVTPTCDMVDQHGSGEIGHPFRIIAPVAPLSLVLAETGDLEQSANLIRSRDAVTPYVYLPPLPGVFEEEQVACLFRPGSSLTNFSAIPLAVWPSCSRRRAGISRSSSPHTGAVFA